MDTREELERKASLLSGADFWHTVEDSEAGLSSFMMTDGPHGLRKQIEGGDHLGIDDSTPATAFPTASASACSFNPALLRAMGRALGEEARANDVAVVLGPGVNMKRSALCGRNFEYFSEDPYLAGMLGAALVEGIQSTGVGACVKHFCANSQETMRMTSDSLIDERTLHELYLEAFRIVVQRAQPRMIMTAYNRLNGIYCSENRELLNDIARKRWGFKGSFVTDWGAMSSSVPSVAAGLDLVMPGPRPDHTEAVCSAVEAGTLDPALLDASVGRLTKLYEAAADLQTIPYTCDYVEHLALAQYVAEESAVLLENNGILPLSPESIETEKIAVIGAFADSPRYQGAGSSHVVPLLLDTALEALEERGCLLNYLSVYDPKDGTADDFSIDLARDVADAADTVLLFVGLPDTYESEGFDREDLRLPESHYRLIHEVCAANKRTVVVLQGGSPMDVSWRNEPAAVLMMYLGGCRSGHATANLLYGDVVPSGKLAESWPETADVSPWLSSYPARNRQVEYREGPFTGYRFYETADITPAYPFGFGRSYTTFSYGKANVEADDERALWHISCPITNTGAYAAAETVQLYVSTPENASFYAPARTLKGFDKVFIEAGETATASFVLDETAFRHFDAARHEWVVEDGTYAIGIGSSSHDIAAFASISVAGEVCAPDKASQAYRQVHAHGFDHDDFVCLYGKSLPQPEPGYPYTVNSTLQDLQDTRIGRLAKRLGEKAIGGDDAFDRMVNAMLMEAPLRAITMGGVNLSLVEAFVAFANGDPKRALKLIRESGVR